MATFGPSLIASFATTADLSSSEYLLVKASADGQVALATAKASDFVVGVLTDGVADGSSSAAGVSVQIAGIAKAKAGAAVAIGAALTCDSSGRAITTTTGGDNLLGRALTAASGANEIIEVLLQPGAQV